MVCLASINATLDWAGAAITKNSLTLPRTWKSSSALHAGPTAKGIASAATNGSTRWIAAIDRCDRSGMLLRRRVMTPPESRRSQCNSDVKCFQPSPQANGCGQELGRLKRILDTPGACAGDNAGRFD